MHATLAAFVIYSLIAPLDSASKRELVARHALQEGRGWHEEEVAGDSTAEVQQFVVVSGRPADEHVLQHPLDGAGRTAVADEERTELSLGSVTEGHVVA